MPKRGFSGSIHEEDKLGRAYDARLMRRLLGYIRPYKGLAAVGLTLTIFLAMIELLFPIIVREAINFPISTGSPSPVKDVYINYLTMLCVIFLIALVARFLFAYMQTVALNMLGQRAMFDLRSRLFRHIEELDASYHSRNPVGRLVTRVTNDIEALNEVFTSGLVTILGDVVLIAAVLALMFTRSWKLALVAIAVGPVLAVITLAFRVKVREYYRMARIKLAQMNTYLQENITGMRVIQMFLREARNSLEFQKINAEHREVSIQSVRYYAMFFPAVDVLASLATGAVVYFGGRLIISSDGAFNFGDFWLFWFLLGRLFEPIRHLAERYNILQSGMASAERVFDILDTSPEITAPDTPCDAGGLRGGIEFRNVSFRYDDEPVLKDMSFRVEPGEKIALVGATGAGKTTIANLIMRHYDTDEGQVLIDGTDIRNYDPKELRNHFGLVLQDVFLFTGTILENIRLDTADISRESVEEAARLVNAHRFIERLPEGYDSPVAERGATFSAGERQLLSFARALVFNPRILILDEATSSVDPETEHLIQEALKTLMKGRTSIIIAHRLSTIQAADRVLVIHQGILREEGTHQELLRKRGIYWKLYQLQYTE